MDTFPALIHGFFHRLSLLWDAVKLFFKQGQGGLNQSPLRTDFFCGATHVRYNFFPILRRSREFSTTVREENHMAMQAHSGFSVMCMVE